MVEVHVDFIPLSASARAALEKNGAKRSVRYATGRMYRKSGMDECAYSSHDGNLKHWNFKEVRKLCKSLKSGTGAELVAWLVCKR